MSLGLRLPYHPGNITRGQFREAPEDFPKSIYAGPALACCEYGELPKTPWDFHLSVEVFRWVSLVDCRFRTLYDADYSAFATVH